MAKSRNEYQREYEKRHPERIKAIRKRWHEKHKEEISKRRSKWRKEHRSELNIYFQNYYGKTKDAVNKNERWSEEEIQMILEHKLTESQLAEKLGRSVKSIQVKRSKLKAEGGYTND